jgi:2-oxoglutarate dehydrogenase E2 component (dihydrolipoamide succinyltransferase)
MAFLARPAPAPPPAPAPAAPRSGDGREERVRMTRLRKTIAGRLKEAQNTAAMLTTFNEVDMTAVRDLRDEYRDAFAKKHGGVRLGFMSFFVRACCVALKEFPAVNAEIDGDDIVYKSFVNMGIAVGGPNGLVVPVIRDADALGFAGIEQAIADFGKALYYSPKLVAGFVARADVYLLRGDTIDAAAERPAATVPRIAASNPASTSPARPGGT